MTYLQENIRWLLTGAPGRDWTAAELQAQLLPDVEDKTCRQVRQAVEYLNTTGLSIISSKKGFRYTKDPEEVLDYLENLERRSTALMRRISHVTRILYGMPR